MAIEVHVLASGSDGNCTVIRNEDRAVMVDAGFSYKKISSLMELNGIDGSEIEAILVTHEHTDHVGGVGATARKLGCKVMCNQATFSQSKFGKVIYEPIRMMNTFSVAGMDVLALPTSHNAIEPCAYVFKKTDNGRENECLDQNSEYPVALSRDAKTILIATDTGKFSYPIMQALKEADIALVEANYDIRMLENGPYPYTLKKLIGSEVGHMSNVDSADAIRKTERSGRQIFLSHLSKTNNEPDIAKDTVSKITGIRRARLDCLDCVNVPNDTRVLKIN